MFHAKAQTAKLHASNTYSISPERTAIVLAGERVEVVIL